MVTRISTRNARFQLLETLLNNRNKRHRAGEFLVQGVRPINLAIEHGWQIRALISDAEKSPSAWARGIIGALPRAERIAMSPELLAELSEKSEGGTELLAVVAMRSDDFSRLPVPSDFLGLVFDRPTQPGNVGSIIRSADAFGAHGIITTGHAADPYDPKAVRASTGSFFALPTVHAESQLQVVEWVEAQRASGVPIVVAASDETGDVAPSDLDLTRPTLLLIGNETVGLSRAWRDVADVSISIPMTGAASSLNAANAASILLYEAHRQRRDR